MISIFRDTLDVTIQKDSNDHWSVSVLSSGGAKYRAASLGPLMHPLLMALLGKASFSNLEGLAICFGNYNTLSLG